MRSVSVLCCATNSEYKSIPYVECYDCKRDARTFDLSTPIVAHPPCRAWSAFCAHQAKPIEGERELGIWCCDVLKKCGGVLEQPAHSRLFDAGGLPKPGTIRGDMWSIEVWGKWFGFPIKKATWLCFSGVDPDAVVIPYRLHSSGSDRRSFQVMSKVQRSHTTREFALWLVDLARQSIPFASKKHLANSVSIDNNDPE